MDTRRYFDPPVHRHTLYRPLWERQGGALPVSDRLARQALSLRMYAHLTPDAVRRVCEAVRRIQRHAAQVRAAGSSQ